jgi:hypothetical protein
VACIVIAIWANSAFRAGATVEDRPADERGAANDAGTAKGSTNDDRSRDNRKMLLDKLRKDREEKKALEDKKHQRREEEALKKNRELPKDQP